MPTPGRRDRAASGVRRPGPVRRLRGLRHRAAARRLLRRGDRDRLARDRDARRLRHRRGAGPPPAAGRRCCRPETSSSPPGEALRPAGALRRQRPDRSPPPSPRMAASRSSTASFRTTRPRSTAAIRRAFAECDAVILSGGTSKGAGDLTYRIVGAARQARHRRPRGGAEARQAALPRGLRRQAGRGAAGLPDLGHVHLPRHGRAGPAPHGRPAGRGRRRRVDGDGARCGCPRSSGAPSSSWSSLVERDGGLVAYPDRQGLGLRHRVRAGRRLPRRSRRSPTTCRPARRVSVTLLDAAPAAARPRRDRQPLHRPRRRARTASRSAASRRGCSRSARIGGLAAARRGECDLAPIHLLDPETGTYNAPFLSEGSSSCRAGGACRGSCSAPAIPASRAASPEEAVRGGPRRSGLPAWSTAISGAGTRILIDRPPRRRPPGGLLEPAEIPQRRRRRGGAGAGRLGRRDRAGGARLRPRLHSRSAEEHYDFALVGERRERPAVRAFLALLAEPGDRRDRCAASASTRPAPMIRDSLAHALLALLALLAPAGAGAELRGHGGPVRAARRLAGRAPRRCPAASTSRRSCGRSTRAPRSRSCASTRAR